MTDCPHTDTDVVDSRLPEELNSTISCWRIRRRKCSACGERFTTYEVGYEAIADRHHATRVNQRVKDKLFELLEWMDKLGLGENDEEQSVTLPARPGDTAI